MCSHMCDTEDIIQECIRKQPRNPNPIGTPKRGYLFVYNSVLHTFSKLSPKTDDEIKNVCNGESHSCITLERFIDSLYVYGQDLLLVGKFCFTREEIDVLKSYPTFKNPITNTSFTSEELKIIDAFLKIKTFATLIKEIELN